jgi:enamine deaminase RidA (YjgF/YER057c/UK114 family)
VAYDFVEIRTGGETRMSDTPNVRLFNPSTIHKPFGYSHVAEITSGKLIYLSGQVALDLHGHIVGRDDFEAQLRQVFANIKAALNAVGADFNDVIKLNYFCAESVDLEAYLPTLRTIRDSVVNTEAPPTSTLVVISRLARPEFLVEVEAIAVTA